ncbi:MAG: carboxypeptidase regulatory-like domain-containing protein [Gemmatimonadaceae bacterium]|nr:carboxypeptidase regulatory-like domain-containing protein [Gemmatimonadaceae bacterium]
MSISRSIPRYRVTGVVAALAVMQALSACGGGGDTPTPPIVDPFPAPATGESAVLFTYRLPSSISSTASTLTPFAGTQPMQLTANGSGRGNLPTGMPVIMGLTPVGSANPVVLGLNVGGTSGTELSTRSTAEAIGFLVPALVTSNPTQANTILSALRASPATAQLTTLLDTRFAGATPEQVLSSADPQVLSVLRTMVTDVLRTTPSPRFDQPARALPAVETATDRGGIQLTTLPQRDAQGRLQVQLDNGQPRWISVVRSYSDDGITWTTPVAENGTFGVMLGAGTQAGQSIQSPRVTIPLTGAPYVRIKTFGLGTDLAGANADPDSRFLYGAAGAQGIAAIAVPALEPVFASSTLRSSLTWGSGDTGPLQSWVSLLLPCFQDPTIFAAIQAGIAAQNFDNAFPLLYRCAMRAGGNSPAVQQGLLTAAGLGNKTAPAALGGMFNVLSTLGTGVEGVFNTAAIRSTRALNTFDVVDDTRFLSASTVAPGNGPVGGGTTITITGSNFPASPVPTVTVGGAVATSVTRVSATQLTAVTAARTSGTVDVVVSAPGYRRATCVNCFVYGALPITVTSVTQPFGGVAGGARVAIAGTNFTAVSTVQFGTRAATNVQVVSATRIDATVPAGVAIGAVNVVVTPTDGSAATCTNCFIYFTPTIAVTPNSASITGGTQITVTDIPATALITAIQLGPLSATNITPLSATSIRFTTPAATATGAVDLSFVYGTVGTLGCPGCFTYTSATSNLGRFTGVVRSAITNNPIAGASISIRTAGTSTQVDVVTTGADGSYRSNPLPAGSYDLHHSAAGYNNSPLFSRTLVGGADTPETSLPVVLMVPTGTANGNLTGTVRDATTNAVIASATVEIRNGGGNTTGAALASTVSAANGTYSFTNLPAGIYTVRATKATYAEGSVNATISQATQTAPVLFMSPTGSNPFVWRVVLSWGTTPSDLDSHLTGPLAGSGSRFHVYFSSRGSLTASPFAYLDVDETNGNGPETITIAQQIAGVYRYYVHRWSSSGEIKTSNARVDLYQGNTLVRQFYPPQQDGIYWTVFELSGSTITTINAINSTVPSVQMAPGTQGGPLRLRGAEARPGDELRSLEPFPAKRGRGGVR